MGTFGGACGHDDLKSGGEDRLGEVQVLLPVGGNREALEWFRDPAIDRQVDHADDEPEDDARVRLYRVCPEAFAPLSDWLDELESFWGDQLQAFKQHAERGAVESRAAKRRS